MSTKEKMEMFLGWRRELALDLNLEIPNSPLVDISDDVKKVAFEKASVFCIVTGKQIGRAHV